MTDAPLSGEFEEALERFDFDAARRIAAAEPEDNRPRLEARIEAAHADAVDRAEQLAGRIQSMARADHYEGLLALAHDPETEPLLSLLTQEIQRGASLHLDGARKRQERFQSAAQKHMAAASEALLLLDTTKARSELDRIDRRWLGEPQRAELDALMVQVEDAAAERRELDARTAEVLRDHHPSQGSGGGRRTATGVPTATTRRGCLTSGVLAVLVMSGLALLR